MNANILFELELYPFVNCLRLYNQLKCIAKYRIIQKNKVINIILYNNMKFNNKAQRKERGSTHMILSLQFKHNKQIRLHINMRNINKR